MKYVVNRHYAGNIAREVEAIDEQEALEKFMKMLDSMSFENYLKALELQCDECNVAESEN